MDTTRTGGPAAAAPKPVECTGEEAVTNAISMPSGGDHPPAIILAIAGRLADATKAAYAAILDKAIAEADKNRVPVPTPPNP